LQTVSNQLGNPCKGLERCDRGIDEVLHDGITKLEVEAQQGQDNSTIMANVCDDMSMGNGHSGDQGQGFLYTGSPEYSDGTLASAYEKCYSTDSGAPFDLSWNNSYCFSFRS